MSILAFIWCLVIVCFYFYLCRMTITKSMELLLLLGALTEDGKLSNPVGHQMSSLPLDPIFSKALIVASQFHCLEEMLIVVSMLSVESISYAPREKLEEVCCIILLQFIYSYHYNMSIYRTCKIYHFG